MIRCAGLTKRFGSRAVLEGIDLTVERGERVALVGLNGAGKTTLFRCVLGLTDFGGEILVDGFPAGPRGKEARGRVAYVPQRPPRFPLALAEFLDLFSALRGRDGRGARERARSLGLDVGEHGGKALGELSGGMLQKAVLALALESGAEALLLDEPTANLDARSRKDLLAVLASVGRDTTLLLASHRLEDVLALADRALVLHRGRVVWDGEVSALWDAAHAAAPLRLWVEPGRVAELTERLRAHAGVRAVRGNGSGLALDVSPGREVDVLGAARQAAPLLGFQMAPPELEEVMDRLLSGEAE